MEKKLGRPKVYENPPGRVGAPKLNIRVDPDVYEAIMKALPSPRVYIEMLVRNDLVSARP